MSIPETIQIKDGVVKWMNGVVIERSNFELYAHLFCKSQLALSSARRKARAKNKAIRPRLIGG
jgi:hypothetical protein